MTKATEDTVEKVDTKQKVIDATTLLFFQKGFAGTSVRDIAERANVNVSLISYYFKSKQGLLEYAVMNYYETYLEELEETYKVNSSADPVRQLKEIIRTMLTYKTEHFHLTSFINRELSLDTTFVREMTVTYLAKEDHLLGSLFTEIVGKRKNKLNTYLFLQLKGMILAPFTVKTEWSHSYVDTYTREDFLETYTTLIDDWLTHMIKTKK